MSAGAVRREQREQEGRSICGNAGSDCCVLACMVLRVKHHTPDDFPEDPRSEWSPAHGPDGRIAYVAEVSEPFVLHADSEEPVAAGDFLAWEDGHYRVIPRSEFLPSDRGWDLQGSSAIEWDQQAGR